MTTTLRPRGPLQQAGDGGRAREYDICVNGRPVGAIEIAAAPAPGAPRGVIRSLRIDEADRRRGRGTVAALAAEEVLRAWGCDRATVSVPVDATAGLRMADSLGYTELSRLMLRELPGAPPGLPPGFEHRPMSGAEYRQWAARPPAWTALSGTPGGPEPDHGNGVLPNGPAVPGPSVSVLLHQGVPVGLVRVGTGPAELVPYLYEAWLDEGGNGPGSGQALMRLAERLAAESGGTALSLRVLPDGTPGTGDLSALGYRVAGREFSKRLL